MRQKCLYKFEKKKKRVKIKKNIYIFKKTNLKRQFFFKKIKINGKKGGVH